MNAIRTLLADDHAVVRAGICQFLKAEKDIEVVAVAKDGEEAKSMILSESPDVAVLDIQMPKATGIEVTRWVRAKNLKIGILILTAYDDDPYVMAVLQAGANGYVLKTAEPADIIQAVRDVHHGKSVLDPAVAGAVMAQITGRSETPQVEPLTDREMEVLRLVAQGFTNKAVGVQLGISARTVQGHLAHIFSKLQVSSRTEAVMRAVSMGWLSQDIGAKPE
ncbi:MAG: response regulator transcription factor [Brevefilum sp.]|nr:response regulator transcription factor [Brevefilum sp.]